MASTVHFSLIVEPTYLDVVDNKWRESVLPVDGMPRLTWIGWPSQAGYKMYSTLKIMAFILLQTYLYLKACWLLATIKRMG